MSVPSIQIVYNDEEVKVFWNVDASGTYTKYDILYSDNIVTTNIGVIADSIPNSPDTYFSKNSITYKFKRETFSIANTSSFKLQLRAYDSVGTTYLGSERYIPSIPEQLSQNKAVQIYGYDYIDGIWRKVAVGSTGALL